MSNLIISTPSHLKSKSTTKRIMIDVIIALAPACIAGIVFFGLWSLALMAIGVAAAVATEFVHLLFLKGGFKDFKNYVREFAAQFDFSSIVTALILVLILPAGCAWYLPLLGSIFAICVTKMLFGGTGKNVVNPAATGRVFLFISFMVLMTTYGESLIGTIVDTSTDVTTGSTPLTALLAGEETVSVLDMFIGTGMSGCIGETCKVALIIGGLYLVVRKVIKWWIPCLYIVGTGIFTVIFSGFDFSVFFSSMLSGGLFFGAVFMITDYTTSPKSGFGNVVYCIFLALITAGLRIATGIEVVSFCIMLGNLIVPFIDTYIVRKPFGYKKKGAIK